MTVIFIFNRFKNLLNMKINLKKAKLLLRVFGTISLVIFLIIQILESNNFIKNYFLYFSFLCFLIILISKLINYLGRYYYKG
jgi:hypothetical protein